MDNNYFHRTDILEKEIIIVDVSHADQQIESHKFPSVTNVFKLFSHYTIFNPVFKMHATGSLFVDKICNKLYEIGFAGQMVAPTATNYINHSSLKLKR